MRRARLIIVAALCTVFGAGVALASWYDDYDAGLDAARKGQWQTVVQKMTAAISGNGNENPKARTYGAIFINYHPYYYRAVAYLNLGKYQQAVADLEKTSGPGPEDLGSINELMGRAKSKLAEASTPPPVETKPPVTATVAPPPVTNTQPAVVTPSIDNNLRNRARAALDQAKTHLQSAQQRKATETDDYRRALTQYTDANTRLGGAKSNDDLNAIIAAADNVAMLADSAQVATVAVTTTTPPPPVNKATGATNAAMGDMSRRLRRALEDYFNGDFDQAERGFSSLTTEMPRNGWIWAFLGASQYSQYAFEGEDSFKTEAIDSFRKAKKYGKWKDGLPEKYFSRRIRKAFKEDA